VNAGLVLLVEDDAAARKLFAKHLELEGFAVLAVEGAEEALVELRKTRPALVISDVNLHGLDGVQLCRQIRADPRLHDLPVVLLSGRRIATEDQIEGIERGADDYLLKPVPGRLLVARARAVLRRFAAPRSLAARLRAEGLELDVKARTVAVRGKPVALTRKEFDLLTVLLERAGEALRHQALLDTVWGIDPNAAVDTETIKTHVSTLRAKLGRELAARIVSVRGVGYRFEAEPKPPAGN
jgi:DNA-binding response OmpR family regulator